MASAENAVTALCRLPSRVYTASPANIAPINPRPGHVFLFSYFFMALVLQAVSYMQQYLWSWLHVAPSKRPDALKMGVIVESDLNPETVLYPATSHPGLTLHAIAAPDVPTAERLASRFHFAKVYDSRTALLDDPTIAAVFVSAPIGLRFFVVELALRKEKHVLCESPLAANANEVKILVDLAKEIGVVLLEGVNWQFHPAAHAWRKLVDSRESGRILRSEAVMTSTPKIPLKDSRWKFNLGGGSTLALIPALGCTRFSLHATTPATVLSVTARPAQKDPRVDAAVHAHLVFENTHNRSVHSRIYTDMARAWAGGFVPRVWELPSIEVETETTVLFFYNFTQPHLYHYISVTDKTTGETTYYKQYDGGPLWGKMTVSTGEKGGQSGWSTYRWQLEAFVDAVLGKTPAYWVAAQESVWNMQGVDAIYRAAGLPMRESSTDGEETKD